MNKKMLIAPLFAGVFMLGTAGAANADAIYYDMCAGNAACLAALTGGVDGWADQDGIEDSGSANSTSEVFNQYAVHAETRTTQFDTDGSGGLSNGDKFSDFGHLNVTNIVPGGGGDNEGMNTIAGFQLTAAWNGLTGTASNLVPGSTPGTFTSNIQYDAVGNATFDFYVDDRSGGPGTRTNFDYGSDISAADDNHLSFTDGVKVLSVLIVGGFGTNTFDAAGNFLTGSSVLVGEVVFALDNFLFFEDGDRDFADLIGSLIKINVSIDQNTDNVATLPCPATPGCPAGALFMVDSDHDGSIEFVLVPEPASVLVFGLGFLALGGLTFMTRRRQA